jgi:hypothetical protein
MKNSHNSTKRRSATPNDDGRDGANYSEGTSNAGIVMSPRTFKRQALPRRVDMAGNLGLSGQDVSATTTFRSSSYDTKKADPTTTSQETGSFLVVSHNDASIEARLAQILIDHPDNERALWLAQKLKDRKRIAEKQKRGPTSRFSISRNVESLGSASKLDIQALYGTLDYSKEPIEGRRHTPFLPHFDRQESRREIVSKAQDVIIWKNSAKNSQYDGTAASSDIVFEKELSTANASSPGDCASNREKDRSSLDSPSEEEFDIESTGGLIRLIQFIEHEYRNEDGEDDDVLRNVVAPKSDQSQRGISRVKEEEVAELSGGQSEATNRVRPLNPDLNKFTATECADGTRPIQCTMTTSARLCESDGEKFESDGHGATTNSAIRTFRWRIVLISIWGLISVAGIVALTIGLLN